MCEILGPISCFWHLLFQQTSLITKMPNLGSVHLTSGHRGVMSALADET